MVQMTNANAAINAMFMSASSILCPSSVCRAVRVISEVEDSLLYGVAYCDYILALGDNVRCLHEDVGQYGVGGFDDFVVHVCIPSLLVRLQYTS